MVDITAITIDDNAERLWGWYLDEPRDATRHDIFAIQFSGWVVGRGVRVSKVAVFDGDRLLAEIPVQLHRPDIPQAFPHFPAGDLWGFSAPVGILGLPTTFALVLQAICDNGSRFRLAAINGTREPLRTAFEPRLQPLMLTSLGRSGSTWVTSLLGTHPQVVGYRPFEFEPRVAYYWMQVLSVLSNPSSYMQGLVTDLANDRWWLGEQPTHISLASLDEPVRASLGRDNVVAAATFCQSRIDAFYATQAGVLPQPQPGYFMEKYLPSALARHYLRELYPGTKEIFLIRDFRDMVCSMLAYNNKTGAAGFGYKKAANDADFVRRRAYQALDHWHCWKRFEAQSYLLRYEDLILRPLETIPAVLRYLDVDASAETTARMLQQASAHHQAGQDYHRTSRDTAASIGRWRTDLDAELQALCADAFGETLPELCYT